jgi:hypothetical protein
VKSGDPIGERRELRHATPVLRGERPFAGRSGRSALSAPVTLITSTWIVEPRCPGELAGGGVEVDVDVVVVVLVAAAPRRGATSQRQQRKRAARI